jgi:hypothetical protein
MVFLISATHTDVSDAAIRSIGISAKSLLGGAGLWCGFGCLLFAEALRERRMAQQRRRWAMAGCVIFVIISSFIPVFCLTTFSFPGKADLVVGAITGSAWLALPATLIGGATALMVFAKFQTQQGH